MIEIYDKIRILLSAEEERRYEITEYYFMP